MRTSESTEKIAAALVAVAGEIKAVEKTGRNREQGYSFASLDDFDRVAREACPRHGLAIVQTVEDATALEPGRTKSGLAMHRVSITLHTRILHASGQWIEVSSRGEGQDVGDKAIYKATTGARKYGLALALGLVTTDDPERDDDRRTQAAPPARKPAPKPAGPPNHESPEGRQPPQRKRAARRGEDVLDLSDFDASRLDPDQPISKAAAVALWKLAHARALEIGDESIDAAVIMRTLLDGFELESTTDLVWGWLDNFRGLVVSWVPPTSETHEGEGDVVF